MKKKLTRNEFIKQVQNSLDQQIPKISGYDLNLNGGFKKKSNCENKLRLR